MPRFCARLALVIAGVSCLATLAFAVVTLASRPLDGSEGNLLFDAARIRSGLRLYVDPIVGVWDYGPVPSRYYVLYTPLWSALLSLLPASPAPILARLLAACFWFGLLGGIALTAARANRFAAVLGALFVAGAYPLALYGAAGRPDALALLVAGVALVRSMQAGRVGPLEGSLFALAAFIKPNVFAAGLGAIAADAWIRRARTWPTLASAAATSAVCIVTLHFASDGAWLEHLTRSTQTSMSARLWAAQLESRLPFFGLPLVLAAWWASRAHAQVARAALVASVAWTVWSLAKIGSASNYWMEPCVAALVIVAHTPMPSASSALRRVAGPLAVAQALWTGVAAVRSSLESIALAPRKAAAILGARDACGAASDAVVLADEPGVEMMVDGRLVQQPVELVHLTRLGKYPPGLWQSDVQRPEVRCLVMQSDLLERPLARVDIENDLFGPDMRRTLRDRFARVAAHDGVWLYRARESTGRGEDGK